MQFFFHEIVARVVAIYLCVDGYQVLKGAVAERKIGYFNDSAVDWLLVDWSRVSIQRDTAPIQYWTTYVLRAIGLAACVVIAIFGWYQPHG